MSRKLSSVSIQILRQLYDLIRCLPPADYSRRLAVFNGSSIGGHTRHIIEFYECLLQGAETGTVNYDNRQRDSQVEQNRDYALKIIEKNVENLKKVDNASLPLVMEARFAESNYSIPSNFAREEAYLIEHTIHHFALIRIGVQSVCPEVVIEPDFGVAYSTIEHQNQS
jgi:uncharacterized SAM-dependent methyltransferase